MRCLFLYNPVSGKGKIAKKAEYIVRRLQEKYDTVDVYVTKGPGDMERAARDAANKYDALVFSGGDGSFNEIVQGIAEAECPPELGYIPSGTVNDIARSLGIPKSIRRAVKVILTGDNALLDCMQINGRYAMYVVAAGAFTSTPYTTPQSQKNKIGKFAYGIEGLKKSLRFDVFDITVNNGENSVTMPCIFVAAMNGRSVAGLKLNKRGSMADGKIEFAAVRQKENPNVFKRVRSFFALAHLFLRGYRVKDKMITRFEGSQLEVVAGDDIVWTFDGEKGACGTVKISVLPKKIDMIVPKGSKNI